MHARRPRSAIEPGARRSQLSLAMVAAAVIGLAAGVGALERSSPAADVPAAPRFKAVAFDLLVLFDPDSVVPVAELAFPGQGRAFTRLWRTRQFEYTWLRSLTETYVDFAAVTDDALVYTAKAMGLALTADRRRRLMDAYSHLEPWPDTRESLRQLREGGVRVIALANFSPAMLEANVEHAELADLFDALVSTDRNHTYKPAARAYGLALEHLQLARADVLFAASAGWDAAGAAVFGLPTVWVNRSNQPVEELGVRPDRTARGLRDVLELVFERAGRGH